MALREYEVVLHLQITGEDPNNWAWDNLLCIGPRESVKVESCRLVREVYRTNLNTSSETEEWLPETEDEG